MVACFAAAWLVKRRLVYLHKTYAVQYCYVNVSSKNKRVFNVLMFSQLLLQALNVTSLLIGGCLSGSLYTKACYGRYLCPMDSEERLLEQNLSDIKKYRDFD